MTSVHLAPPSGTSSKLSTSPSSSTPIQQASTSSSSHSHHHHHHHHSSSASIPTASLVEPPALFASVAPQIYRSATPTPSNHTFLRTLQLRTILSLTAELPSPSLTAFCRKHGIRFLHFGLKRWGSEDLLSLNTTDDSEPALDLSFLHTTQPTSFLTPSPTHHQSSPTLTEELVKDSLQILLTSSYHPVLVTDTSGIHEIGVLLGCLRKLQRWNFATILLEYRHFAGNRARATNERFVEMFDTDLVVFPEDGLPEWFREQIEEDDRELERLEGSCG
ncbi:Protein-tyrosine phosphatase, SIW14-like protein [Kalmanozyma brasiliensis GHG001]|uniref:Protein-tyrosine phosphatase, SIW14-like protein n=1 Tax=Kalmanozyma brasiliensis (strain GHG001) TaxID=1365824 RepID=UPI001CEB50E3|nr:Protein-tyrosine phosphatase, SIW14-like protein [Kalmanozyma brasiliensis GHG001]EST08334.2 Protein-tyrosine phosphatase, SIW14-like protein [Kalmanozyma brasiliensis GHG001]